MRFAFVLLPCLLLAGCVQSLNPLYTDPQLTYDPAYVGKWVDKDGKNTLIVVGDAEHKQYAVTHIDENGKTGVFIVHLAKVDKSLIADVAPSELKTDESDTYKAHFVPVHSFMIVNSPPPKLTLMLMNEDWFKKLMTDHPESIAHEKIGDDRYLITADTDSAQAFIVKNLTTPGAYGVGIDFTQVNPATQK